MKPHDLNRHVRRASREVREFLRRLEAGEATARDDPRPSLSDELFAVWSANRDVEGAGKVLRTAFKMWGALGKVEKLENALPELDSEAGYWSGVIGSLAAAYSNADRLAELPTSLQRLEPRLTRPASRVALYSTLGRFYLWFTGEPVRARACYESVLDLTSDPVQELWARGALYEIDHLQPGHAAPDFSAAGLDGRRIRLRDFRGRVALLAFWSADCGPCWPEMPHLRKVRVEHDDRDLVLIGISKDNDLERCREVVQAEGLHWPQIWEPYPQFDPRSQNADDYAVGTIARGYNVWAIPRAFLIGRDGRIVSNVVRGEQMIEDVRVALQTTPR